MAFKVCDMLERIYRVRVDFDQAAVFMFKDPMKAAKLCCENWHGPGFIPSMDVDKVVNRLVGEFQNLSAPPHNDRPIGLQEVETVLCKWKSHLNGHYPLYNDIYEIDAGLATWDFCKTARDFRAAMPEGIG